MERSYVGKYTSLKNYYAYPIPTMHIFLTENKQVLFLGWPGELKTYKVEGYDHIGSFWDLFCLYICRCNSPEMGFLGMYIWNYSKKDAH